MRIEEIRKAGYYPIEGKTVGQPFPTGRGGSVSFRIPGLIRLHNGNLLATSDARWTRPDDDCGGIDTVFALSEDRGESWRAGYAAYFPDSLGSPRDLRDATILIDSTPVETPDGVLHIFVNLGPTGVTTALRRPGRGEGFMTVGGKKRLALTDDDGKADGDPAEYPYFVGELSQGFAPILTRAEEETGFAVDPFFNLYRKDGGAWRELLGKQIDTGREIVQNVFYRDSSFHVYHTMYLLHLSSLDWGESWSWTLVDGIKMPDETAVIASPGNGLVTSDGVMVLPFYRAENGGCHSFLAFSSDGGKSFRRSPVLPPADGIPESSEGKPVELPNGDLRLFFRTGVQRICWADCHRASGAWGEAKALPVRVHSDCNFAALCQDGRILIAYARGIGDDARYRMRGRLYVFALDEKNDMILTDVLPITDGAFSYAVLAPVSENEAACLYDTCGDGLVIFQKIGLPGRGSAV